ncbi:MAG: ribosome silencing factor [Bacteroidales bacterium]|nr:ribosome silencing factor [Bacteroidales bacterium]MBR4453316.1 ribosome silencing factor [Bacteroidales bacterium]
MTATNKKLTRTNEELTDCIIDALQEKKAQQIVKMDLSVLQVTLFDRFIICTATSNTQAEALCDNVCMKVKQQLGILPSHVEGISNAQWILIDYFNVMVHIFLPEMREYYNLEGLWADAQKEEFAAI